MMDAPSTGDLVIALAIGAHAFAYWIKSPKEDARDLEIKVGSIDTRLTALEIEHARTHATLSTTVEGLRADIAELKLTVERFIDKLAHRGARNVRSNR